LRVLAMTCAPVYPSVTHWICIKMVQARITNSLLCAASMTVVFRDKMLHLWVQGPPSNEGIKRVASPKNVILLLLAHISRVNCDKMPEDRPRQPEYKIVSIKHRF